MSNSMLDSTKYGIVSMIFWGSLVIALVPSFTNRSATAFISLKIFVGGYACISLMNDLKFKIMFMVERVIISKHMVYITRISLDTEIMKTLFLANMSPW